VPASPLHNLRLASQSRARVVTALLTHHSTDRDIDLKRVAALRAYIPFARAMFEQYNQLGKGKEAQDRAVKAGGVLEWSSAIQVGARPNAQDQVPYFRYGGLDFGEELAHCYLTLGLCLYQRAGALSFHALQLADSIPPCGVLNLLPWFAAECAAMGGDEDVVAAASASQPRKPMFNPLSYVPPAPSASKLPGGGPPKSAAEIGDIRSQVIAKRREAVECLRQAAGIFDHLSSDLLPTLPIPQARMVDTMPGVSEALKRVCLIHCQQHTFLSALLALSPGSTSPAPSPPLLAKLCQGILDELAEVKALLQRGTGSYYNALEPSLHVWLRATADLYRAQRLKVLAMQAVLEDDAHGRALVLLSGAESVLSALASNDAARGLPLQSIRDCNPVLSELKTHAAHLLGNTGANATQLRRVKQRLQRDNDTVYYQTLPKSLEEALKDAGDPAPAAAELAAAVAGTPAPTGASSAAAAAAAAATQRAPGSRRGSGAGGVSEADDGSSDRAASVFLPKPLPFDVPPPARGLFLLAPSDPQAASWTGGSPATPDAVALQLH